MMNIVGTATAIALFGALASCKAKPDAAAEVREDCEKLAVLQGGQWSALDKDRCLGELGSLGPNQHACFHTGIQAAKTDDDWEAAKNDCTGFVDHSGRACSLTAAEGQAAYLCNERHRALESTKPEVYRCWARCGMRAKTSADALACDASCGVPPS